MTRKSASLLPEILSEANQKYRRGEDSGLTDTEYDALLENLPEDHFLRTQVGAPVLGTREDLPVQLGSLNKVKTEEEFSSWVEKMKSQTEGPVLCVTPKLDGCTMELEYTRGVLTNAWTRGDGIEGGNIFEHAYAMPSIPNVVTTSAFQNSSAVYVIGEAIMPLDVFELKYASKYKNPRNLVAGSLGKKEVSSRTRDIQFFAFNVHGYYAVEGVLSEQGSLSAFLHNADTHGFLAVNAIRTDAYADFVEMEAILKNVKVPLTLANLQMDGAVVAVDSRYEQSQIGNETSSLNPAFARAWKPHEGTGQITTVTKINWQVSKNGVLTPVAVIEPLELSGVTVTNVTAHNREFVEQNRLGIGSEIKVIRSGDVIPYITEVVTESEEYELPLACEYCGEGLIGRGVNLVHINNEDACVEVKIQKTVAFFTIMDVDGFREGTVRRIYERYPLISGIIEILDMVEEDFENMGNFTFKGAKKLLDEVHRKMNECDRSKLMHGTGLFSPGLGSRKLRDILKGIPYSELETMRPADMFEQILGLDGFAETTATIFCDNFPDYVEFEDKFHGVGVGGVKEPTVAVDSAISGKSFVFTGFRDKELQDDLESKGASVKSSVSKKTDFLVCKDPSSTSGKVQKAKDLGVKAISIEEAKEMS